MNDLFIKNSKFDVEKLREAKEFLLELKEIIVSSYNMKHAFITEKQDKTEFHFGDYYPIWDGDKFSDFKLTAHMDGTITFEPKQIKISNEVYNQLVDEGVKFDLAKKAKYDEPFMLVKINVGKITRDNIETAVKYIVMTIEGEGHFKPLTLKR